MKSIIILIFVLAASVAQAQLKRKVVNPPKAPTSGTKSLKTKTSPSSEARARVDISWLGEGTVLLTVDGKEMTLNHFETGSLNLRTGKALTLELKTPAKTFYPETFLKIHPSGGLVNLKLLNEKVVFSYQSGQEIDEENAFQKAKDEREAAERKRILAMFLAQIVAQKDQIISQLYDQMVEVRKGSEVYYIGKYEVSQKQWMAVMGGDNPSDFFNCQECPVNELSWDYCQKFISKLNAKTGKNYRLPTEAEWEFAARGGEKSNGYKFAGSNNLEEVAWYEANSGGTTHPVGQKRPNELGLYDMSGNVEEWCEDLQKKFELQMPVRGGRFTSDDSNPNFGVAYQSFMLQYAGGMGNGFRLALSSR
jgi:hypothetical protein